MQQITARRWVRGSPPELWRRLADLESLAADVPGIELVEPFAEPGAPVPGDTAVLAHRTGHRVVQLRFEVVTNEEPHHLTARVDGRGGHWLLTVDLTALDDGASDVLLRAEPDTEAAPGPAPLASRTPVLPRRTSDSVEALLEALADHVELPPSRP